MSFGAEIPELLSEKESIIFWYSIFLIRKPKVEIQVPMIIQPITAG